MFEIEELFDLTIEGAFEGPEDFNAFAKQASPEELYSVMIEGAFESPEELEASFKKKDDTAFGLGGGSSELTPLSRNQQLGVTPTAEKDTAIERMFGKNEVTDFFGDLYRSGVQGQAQGATVDDALNLFAKGQDISDEDLKEYIESVRNMESFGPSEEMQDFTKIYEKNGKGLWGFLSGVAQNPTVIPQLFTSSVSAMFNKGSIAGGVAGAVTGGVGAGLATGGIAAIPGALIGGIGGVSGALETGLSYTEFLKEELDKEGLSFDEDNVKKILLNEEAMNSIKNKALARGLTIAAIDAFSGGLATSITRKTATKLGSKLAGAAAGGTVEALGGATGEAAARLVAGQEMDIAEIGFEGVAGTATAPLTIGAGLMKPPSYSMNGGKASRKDIQTLLSTGTPEQIAAVKISVKNDSDLYKEAQTKKSDIMLLAEIETANPGITEKDKAELLVLEKARQTLENSSIKSAKNNLKLIDEKIDVISKRYLPTEKEILTKKEKDAVQESSAEGVVLREQARDGEGVGVKDSKPAEKITPQEETVAPTDQEITQEADVTEVVKEKDGVTTTNFEKIIKGRKRSNSLAPISVLDNYELDLEANNIEGMDIVGVREIRKKEGVTNATILVRLGDEQFEAEVVLQDKAKEGANVTELTEDEKLEKVTKEKVKKLVTAPRRITEPFKIGQTTVTLNEDGTIKSAVNSKGVPVKESTLKIVQKKVLENVIDIDSGEKATVVEGIAENNIDNYILENSSNIREIAFSIKNQRSKLKDKKQLIEEAKDATKLNDLEQSYFTIEDLAKNYDKKILEEKDVLPGTDLRTDKGVSRNIRRYWTIPAKDKFGRSSIGVSDFALTAESLGITPGELVDIIVQFPTRNVMKPTSGTIVETDKPSTLIELQEKFESLTGIAPAASIVDFVIGIEEGRVPLDLLKALEKEQLTRQAAEPVVFGKKRGPSAKKITTAPKKEITVDEIKALKDQIRLEAKAAREAKGDQTARRKAISNAINALKVVGKINLAKAKSLINKISTVDLNKAIQVEKALAYVEKVFTTADYDAKLSEAESLRKSIKNLSKTEKLDVYPVEAAKRFSEIDPVLVEDIESYIEEAKKVKDGVTPSTKTKTMPALDIKKTDEYTTSEVNKQKKIKLEAEKEVFQELTGLSPDEFSLQDMREIVNGVEQDQPDDVREKELESKAKTNADVIKKGLNKAFNTVSTIVNQLIEAETDPFTGEIIELTKEQKKLVKDFLNIDINKLSDADAVIALDSLINFATNKTTGGMGAVVERNEGIVNSNTAKALNLIAKPLAAIVKGDPGISRNWNKYIASLPIMLESMFKGQAKALLFEKLSGIKQIINGAAEAESYAKKITDQYYEKFIKLPFSESIFGKTKTNPNGEVFNSAFNDIERGMFAFMRRSIPGEEQVEFDRRKSLIEQSIERLSKQGGVDSKKAEVYNEVYEKILKDASSAAEVEAQVDKTNVEAVQWMTDIWAQNYKSLSDVNLNIYNKILGKDFNYTPDSFALVEDISLTGEIGEPIFDFGYRKISDKKSGVLMDVQRPGNLPKGRIINLGFDSQNISNLEKARTDINTAGAIQKAKGFFESSNFEDIVPSKADRDILKERVSQYVEAKRGRQYIKKDAQKFLKVINLYSGYAVSRTLGGLTQVVKQTIPVLVNTMINAGVENIGIIGDLVSDSSLAKFLENSGYPIVNRGLQSSTTLESNNTKIENAAKGGFNKLVRGMRDVQSFWLQKFLVNPDRYIAQASWMMYYTKSLNEQGVDTSNIDWENHEVNTKAGDYAQQQVDRQQNITDADLQGEVFRSKNPGMQVLRRVLLPFANFLLNQKARMYSDVTTLFSKTSDTQDKKSAGRSLTGLVAETIAFNALGLVLTQALSAMSAESEDDKKAKEQRLSNRFKGRAGQAIKDVLSPLPLPQLEGPLISGINALIRAASESKDPYQFFELQPEDAWERLGVLSIPTERFAEWNQMRKMAFTGEYEQKLPFGKTVTKKLKPAGRDEMLANWISYTLYSAGLAPSEVGTVARYNMKQIIKKKTKK